MRAGGSGNVRLEHVPYTRSQSVQKFALACNFWKSLAWEQGPALRIGTHCKTCT
jgi:hypothetical protein